MKKYYKLFTTSLLIVVFIHNISAQVQSVMGEFSPSSSTLIGSASRIGYDDDYWTTYYMRYSDSAYFCSNYYYSFFTSMAPAVSSTKIGLSQDFVITDFKKFLNDPGYIGSYQGQGMYGYSFHYYYNLNYGNFLQIITLPAVDRLNRTDMAHPLGANAVVGMKFFSIGEKTASPNTTPGSYLLEHYLWLSTSYSYAPLANNPTLNEQEIADDVITTDGYVIYATRDTRSNHAPVNLRISDTNNVLSYSSDINNQWGFWLPDYEQVYGKVRLISLGNKKFVLAYTIFNSKDNKYYLDVHRIILPDFIAGYSSMVSHEITLDKPCSDLTDMLFNPNVSTLVVLLNGDRKSAFYHLNPYSNINDITTRLHYPKGNFYSIDTAGSDYSINEVLYTAMGDSVIFLQNISNGIDIVKSCLEMTKVKYLLREPPVVVRIHDPLDFYSGSQQYEEKNPEAPLFYGMRICNKSGRSNETK